MKISKLLNRKLFSIILIFFISLKAFAEDKPVDIWKIETENSNENSSLNEISSDDELQSSDKLESDIYKMQTQKKKI